MLESALAQTSSSGKTGRAALLTTACTYAVRRFSPHYGQHTKGRCVGRQSDELADRVMMQLSLARIFQEPAAVRRYGSRERGRFSGADTVGFAELHGTEWLLICRTPSEIT